MPCKEDAFDNLAVKDSFGIFQLRWINISFLVAMDVRCDLACELNFLERSIKII